jgi:thymidylate synthase
MIDGVKMKVSDIREYFKNELKNKRFTTDRTGSKTIEMIPASFLADEPAIFGEVNQDYVNAELEWYKSQSTNINKLAEIYGKSPVAWQYSANKYGEINSNYGKLVYSDKYHNQFENALNELVSNPDSRRAQLTYTRPSIWVEYDEDGKNDFICTLGQLFYIRDNKLHMVSSMRSNDVIFGYRNDYAWAKFLMKDMVERYNEITGEKIVLGDLIWQVCNLHVYERHFNLIV